MGCFLGIRCGQGVDKNTALLIPVCPGFQVLHIHFHEQRHQVRGALLPGFLPELLDHVAVLGQQGHGIHIGNEAVIAGVSLGDDLHCHVQNVFPFHCSRRRIVSLSTALLSRFNLRAR